MAAIKRKAIVRQDAPKAHLIPPNRESDETFMQRMDRLFTQRDAWTMQTTLECQMYYRLKSVLAELETVKAMTP